LIETDSPFLTPNAYRGKRNRPVFIVETLKFLAKLRNMSVDKLADILFNNSLKAYHLRLSDLVYYDTTENDEE
jgi:TatD DNase family protein